VSPCAALPWGPGGMVSGLAPWWVRPWPGLGRSMPTWETALARPFWAPAGRAPAAASPPNSETRPATLPAVSFARRDRDGVLDLRAPTPAGTSVVVPRAAAMAATVL